DDALLRLRFNHEEIGLVLVRSRGDAAKVLEHDAFLSAHQDDRFLKEVRLKLARVLRRFDLTARSLFAIMDPESCFSGSLLELAPWQTWIFTRPNATGEAGALSLYGRPERPSFDWRRT